ncbi:EF-hand domain-containing protein [Sphingomonas sp. VNH70]|uniref:EF-hand domain-containing protein n=1 Tax=Sphingomonas silueang TaxID=3156617 RepID=UPI0032B34E7A
MVFALLLGLQTVPPPVPAPGDRPAAATLVVEPVGMFLAACDADGDARTTLAEAQACVARSFPAGQNAIGYIAFADWAERRLGDRNALPGPFEVDRDGDNRITPDELQARIVAIFRRIDRDGDGVLTRGELLTIRTLPGRADGRGRRERR